MLERKDVMIGCVVYYNAPNGWRPALVTWTDNETSTEEPPPLPDEVSLWFGVNGTSVNPAFGRGTFGTAIGQWAVNPGPDYQGS